MPVPEVKKGKWSKERERTKSGRWRRKRSDTDQPREKKSNVKYAIALISGITVVVVVLIVIYYYFPQLLGLST